jgi:hypothetical protein
VYADSTLKAGRMMPSVPLTTRMAKKGAMIGAATENSRRIAFI